MKASQKPLWEADGELLLGQLTGTSATAAYCDLPVLSVLVTPTGYTGGLGGGGPGGVGGVGGAGGAGQDYVSVSDPCQEH